jgi:NAD(P)-dependent dehydrogenase (short-subunit alcohol dehydrogenase family)
MGELDGKIAVLTGAGSGKGRACAQVFVREGAKVVVADVSVEYDERIWPSTPMGVSAEPSER